MEDISELSTEKRNMRTMKLDEMTPYQIISIMNEEDHNVVEAVHQALPQIEKTIQWTTQSLQSGGRILYIGAGTSGRIGILDAVECPPTFGVSYNMVVGVIAGGQEAFVKAKEGAEDDPELGKKDLQDHQLTAKDVVIGLAASGRTPYVIGALRYARELGSKTVAISNNKEAPISAEADLAIELLTGPEVLTGSTRLKAGTAEKMVLNMISTASMVGIGKVYENLMVDVRQSNEKLVIRSENIVMEAVGCTREEARKNLKEVDGKTKLAITKMLLGCDAVTAGESLKQAGGKVKAAISKQAALQTIG
ncbi:MAG: N-acetylmuramic acid 6-phosphate etherase [Lachnospiraceae bacterium]